jgi:hypothetical protein
VIASEFGRAALALGVAAGAIFAVPATASTTRSWAQLKPRVVEACRQQSGLRSARVTEYWPAFDAQAAAMVVGEYPQRHMKGRRGAVLCLYDKRTGTAQTQEAVGP